MSGKLSTHVLDTRIGKPGAGMAVHLFAVTGAARVLLKSATTNADGRTDTPLLLGEALTVGVYELDFHAGDYYRAQGTVLPNPPFLDIITLRFGVADVTANYHVPLLCTPWSYATYRGS